MLNVHAWITSTLLIRLPLFLALLLFLLQLPSLVHTPTILNRYPPTLHINLHCRDLYLPQRNLPSRGLIAHRSVVIKDPIHEALQFTDHLPPRRATTNSPTGMQ